MRRILTAAVLLFAAAPAFAGTNFTLSCLAVPGGCAAFQPDFNNITQDLTGGLHYQALQPATPEGITGFDIGAIGSYTPVQFKQSWKNLTGSDVNAVGMAGIAVSKGLPFGIDVGATFTGVPGTRARLWGAELRYAILSGGIAEPALALRAAYMASSGIDHFKYSATSADLTLSKGFTILTPYAGAGFVRGRTDPDASTGLTEDTVTKGRVFAGLRLSLLLLEITPEYERTGHNNSYNLRAGISF